MKRIHPPHRKSPPRRLTYLLRCWEEFREKGEREWRFSLEDPLTGERWGFGQMEAMVHFLYRRLAEEMNPNGGKREGKGYDDREVRR